MELVLLPESNSQTLNS